MTEERSVELRKVKAIHIPSGKFQKSRKQSYTFCILGRAEEISTVASKHSQNRTLQGGEGVENILGQVQQNDFFCSFLAHMF